jgi:hypothetical protein
MKLNMGCGHNKLEGHVNVDLFPECKPDMVVDLESMPWPWPDAAIDGVVFHHSLEHLGESTRTFFRMMQELYRICRDGAEIRIDVPHPRHDDFLNDPTHVRIITPALLTLFDRKINDEWQRMGASNSPLAHYLHVDFAVVSYDFILSDPYATQYADGLLSKDDVDAMSRELNNFVREYRIRMVVRKGS